MREPCTEGTRVDILERVYQWALNTSPNSPSIFWLTGQAGSGKSTIAYTVARHFDEGENGDPNPGPNILGANFFCSRQFEETRRRSNIILTLVYKLSRQCKSYATALYNSNKFDSAEILNKQMKDLLVDPWAKSISQRPSEFPPYLIVVDALDEIENEGGSSFLRGLVKTVDDGHLKALKFFITSRPDPELADLCASFESDAICHLYNVPTDTVKADIATYLKAKLLALQDKPQLSRLVEKADGLFIYAATAVRYICPQKKMAPQEQLSLMNELLCSMPDVTAGPSLIDNLYQQILSVAFRGFKGQIFRDRLNVLHTFLCTEERVSTSVAGRLTSDSEGMKEIASLVVESLHAVLYIKENRVLWYHASFPDFIFEPSRSNFNIVDTSGSCRVVMSCDLATHHAFLAHLCFNVMASKLRFNICNLPSSFLLDSEVPDLKRQVEENISDVLEYSCRYWAQHLTRAMVDKGRSFQDCISEFLTLRILFWIETMNLLGSSGRCSPILHQAREWVVKVS